MSPSPLSVYALGGACLLPLAACTFTNVCGSHSADVLGTDGGVYRCVQAEDCPRPANTTVCASNNLPEVTCVTCEDTRCVAVIPEPCR